MSYINTEKAFKWLFQRFQAPNIKPCQFDLDCLTEIAKNANTLNSTAFQENTIFAKMYVYCLSHELEFYKDMEFAQKKLHEVLDAPLEVQYKKLGESLNRLELNKFSKRIGLSQNHPFSDNEREKAKNDDLIRENQKEMQMYVLGKWNSETVAKSLNKTITNEISKHRNKI